MMKLKQMCGTSRSMLPSRLDEFMWRQVRGRTNQDAFNNIFIDIAEQYHL